MNDNNPLPLIHFLPTQFHETNTTALPVDPVIPPQNKERNNCNESQQREHDLFTTPDANLCFILIND